MDWHSPLFGGFSQSQENGLQYSFIIRKRHFVFGVFPDLSVEIFN